MSENEYSVALIEDDKFVAQAIKVFLTRKGFKVVQAENGAQGLELIKAEKPDVVLCDRNMPEMSGFDLLKTIREGHPDLNEIPFIFLTGLSDPRDKHATASLMPDAYLTKPVDIDELLTSINRAIEKRKNG